MKNRGILVKRVMLLIALTTSMVLLNGCGGDGESAIGETETDAVETEYEVEMIPDVVEAKMNLEGDLVLPDYKGHTATVPDAIEAFRTPERKKFVYINGEGTLCFIDNEDDKKYVITKDVKKIHELSDEMIVFEKNDGSIYYSIMESQSVTLLSESVTEVICSKNKEYVACVNEQNEMVFTSVIKKEEKKKTQILAGASLEYISDDGKTYIYSVIKDETCEFVIRDIENKKQWRINKLPSEEVQIFASKDGWIWILTKSDNQIIIKEPEKKPRIFSLDVDVIEDRLFWDSGSFASEEYVNGEFVYVYVKDDDCWKFLSVSKSGEVKTLLSDVYIYDLSGGTVVYSDHSKKDMTYFAKLENGEILSTKKVAPNVSSVKVSYDGKYIYYTTTDNAEEIAVGDLHCCWTDTGKSKLIDENVFIGSGLPEHAAIYPTCEGIIYGKDLENTKHGTVTLMIWNMEEEESVLVGHDIIAFSVSSGYKYDKIDPRVFKYARLAKIDAKGNPIVEWATYNGERIETIFTDTNLTSVGYCYW